LTSLDHTIREGNSVISYPAVHPRAFPRQAAFPEVFAQGGFDVVILFVYPPVNNPVQSTGLLEGPHRGTNRLLAIVQGHSPTPTATGRGF